VPFLRAVAAAGKRSPALRGADQARCRSLRGGGLDRGSAGSPAVTSRGYGAGRLTLFHHPPSSSEVRDLLVDIEKNVAAARGWLTSRSSSVSCRPDSRNARGRPPGRKRGASVAAVPLRRKPIHDT